MTPAAFLAHLVNEGASLTVAGDRIRVEAPIGMLTPAVKRALADNKAALLGLLRFADEYRAVLADAGMDEAAFRDAQARLIDELGPALATAIHRSVDGAYSTESRISVPPRPSRSDAEAAETGLPVGDKPWKAEERRAAGLCGGTRFPANGGGRVDFEGSAYVGQVKHVRRLSLAGLEALAVEVASIGAAQGKAGVVVVKRRAGSGCLTTRLVVMTDDTFKRLTGKSRHE
jgi:hypothetical protein